MCRPGSSDDHTAGRGTGPTASPIGSPTTRVLADGLSEAAIVDAIRHGRTMVQLRGPDDPELDVTMRTRSGGSAEIGDDVDGIDRVRLTLRVTGGAGTFAQLWRDGAMVAEQQPITGDDVTLELDDTPGAGDFRYRVELIDDANHRLVVTSHFYVHAIAAAGGCGGGAGGDLGGGLAAVAMALPWLRRRRRPISP